MARIFLPLAGLSACFLVVAMVLGLMIEDPKVLSAAAQASVQYHFLAAVGALVFATFVHAIVLTYFMGTGRWIEESSSAYRLNPDFYAQSNKIKYRTIPLMVICFLLLLTTGALGAAADPASPWQGKGWGGMSASSIHLTAALITIGANLLVTIYEFVSLEKNGAIVDQVLAEVRRIRLEKGLAVDG